MKIIKTLTWLVIVLVFSAGGYFVYQDRESIELNAQVRASLPGDFIQTPHGVIHYELAGPKNSDLVVLVHGFSVPNYLWEPTYQFLLQQGYQVLRFDLFGRGLSDRPDEEYGLELFSDQINDLLTALKVNRPIQLLGLSMGGPVVTRFTNRYPEKVNSLILQDPLVNQLAPGVISPLEIPYAGEYLFCTYLLPNYVNGHKNDPSKGHHFAHWGDQYKQQLQYKGFRKALLSSLRYMAKYPFIQEYQKLATIEMPKLLIWGSDDQTIPISEADVLIKLMPKMQYQVIQGAGHVPSMEMPDAFNTVLLKFLREHPWKPKE
jgi:pimeloyl-ACP methyl ester carboxylesterase